ncbi:hypothetical protein FIBSPDRAFT_882084 [Athelia psychrophila]|uniref:Uncharacterized protein n=1 Tax=Athelia psychrophila TaxID=1759441 RepID=A0A166W3W8_9AGAM|nr:hypothetical protein FIBSPDRAFT_882084 [Fibularhizoctonia sp. CBS 109695]
MSHIKSVDIPLDCTQQEELQPSGKGFAEFSSSTQRLPCSRMKAYGKMMEKRLTIEEEHATHRDAKEMKRTAITILGWARVVGGTKQTSRNQHRRATSSSRMSRNIYSLAPSAVPYADMRSDPPIPRDAKGAARTTAEICSCLHGSKEFTILHRHQRACFSCRESRPIALGMIAHIDSEMGLVALVMRNDRAPTPLRRRTLYLSCATDYM